VDDLHRIEAAVERDAVLAACGRSGRLEPTKRYQQLLEAAGDIKPRNISIASSANVFAGNEADRSQVQQFVGLLTRIAIVANGSVTLLSHPSLTGIATDTGLSGSTQSRASRSRCGCRVSGTPGSTPTPGRGPDSRSRRGERAFRRSQPSAGRVPFAARKRPHTRLTLPTRVMVLRAVALVDRPP
jgi:hypothetical protein